ncbi:hypothetical protein BJ508DRAFT_76749 [Ascobolus immersus RN42]|uniref:Uncharacterized protein n=1 Tax=Ascobolus immersus RN42 TaxID=1160509 RepID=A0A3N4HF74_ASCIM|nr:hypothetical protein BJ508DRAFT_76749 [Ascobolus immersus RN42]
MSSTISLLAKGNHTQTLAELHTAHLADPHNISIRIDASIASILLSQFQRVISEYLSSRILENVENKPNEDERKMAGLVMAFARMHVDLDADSAWEQVKDLEGWILGRKGSERYGVALVFFHSIYQYAHLGVTNFQSPDDILNTTSLLQSHLNSLLNLNEFDEIAVIHALPHFPVSATTSSSEHIWRYETVQTAIDKKRALIDSSSNPAEEDRKLAYLNFLKTVMTLGLVGAEDDVDEKFETVDVTEGLEHSKPMDEKKGEFTGWRDLLAVFALPEDERDVRKVKNIVERFAQDGDWRGVDAGLWILQKAHPDCFLMRAGLDVDFEDNQMWLKRVLQMRCGQGSELAFWAGYASFLSTLKEEDLSTETTLSLCSQFYKTKSTCTVPTISYNLTLPIVIQTKSLQWADILLDHAALTGNQGLIQQANRIIYELSGGSSTADYYRSLRHYEVAPPSVRRTIILESLYRCATQDFEAQYKAALELTHHALTAELKAGSARPTGAPWAQVARDVAKALADDERKKSRELRIEAAVAASYVDSHDTGIQVEGRHLIDVLLSKCTSANENLLKADLLYTKARAQLRSVRETGNRGAFKKATAALDESRAISDAQGNTDDVASCLVLTALLWYSYGLHWNGEGFKQALSAAEEAEKAWRHNHTTLGGLPGVDGVFCRVPSLAGDDVTLFGLVYDIAEGLNELGPTLAYGWVQKAVARSGAERVTHPPLPSSNTPRNEEGSMEDAEQATHVYYLPTPRHVCLLIQQPYGKFNLLRLKITTADVRAWLGKVVESRNEMDLETLVSPLPELVEEGELIVAHMPDGWEELPLHRLEIPTEEGMKVLGDRNEVVYAGEGDDEAVAGVGLGVWA